MYVTGALTPTAEPRERRFSNTTRTASAARRGSGKLRSHSEAPRQSAFVVESVVDNNGIPSHARDRAGLSFLTPLEAECVRCARRARDEDADLSRRHQCIPGLTSGALQATVQGRSGRPPRQAAGQATLEPCAHLRRWAKAGAPRPWQARAVRHQSHSRDRRLASGDSDASTSIHRSLARRARAFQSLSRSGAR